MFNLEKSILRKKVINMRKKFTTGCLLAITLLMTVSCGRIKLEIIANSMNKECPIYANDGYIARVECSGDEIIITAIADDDFTNMNSLRSNKDVWKRCAIQSSTWYLKNEPNGNGEILYDFLKEIAEAGGNLTYKYINNNEEVMSKQTDNTATLTLSNKELRTILKKNPSALDLLKCEIEVANLSFPMTIKEGIRMTKITFEGDYIVYNFVLDEDLYYIEAYNDEEVKKEFKKGAIEESFSDSNDPKMQMIKKLLKETGKGISYKLIGDASRKAVYITIEQYEL